MISKTKFRKERVEFRGDKTTLIIGNEKYSTKLADGDIYSQEFGVLMCIAKANGYNYKDIQEMIKHAKTIDNKKLKIGDRVFVHYTIPYGKRLDNLWLNEEMAECNHKIYTICDIDRFGYKLSAERKVKTIIPGCYVWHFHRDWLIKVEE